MVMDYNMEIECVLRPIHRYIRKERFVMVLNQLLGKNFIKVDLNEFDGVRMDAEFIWNDVWNVLKVKGKGGYNHIPGIIKMLGFGNGVVVDNETYQKLVLRFLVVQDNWTRRVKDERVYFLPLRFVVLMIMKEFGVCFDYCIPLVRNNLKLERLLLYWNKII
jgi:hypothetical protein